MGTNVGTEEGNFDWLIGIENKAEVGNPLGCNVFECCIERRLLVGTPVGGIFVLGIPVGASVGLIALNTKLNEVG